MRKIFGLVCLVLLTVLNVTFGTFESELMDYEQLSETTYLDYSKLRVKKTSENSRKLFGNITILIDLDNSILVDELVYVKQGGEYRAMPYKVSKKGFCDLMKKPALFEYEDLASTSDWPPEPPCPMKKGRYEYRGFDLTYKNFNIKLIETGDYALESIYWKDNQVIFKARMYVRVFNSCDFKNDNVCTDSGDDDGGDQ